MAARVKRFLLAGLLGVLLSACGGDDLDATTGGPVPSTTTTGHTGGGGSGAEGGSGGSGATGGDGGSGGNGGSTTTVTSLEALLEGLRTSLEKTLHEQSLEGGWPAPVEGGHLFVSVLPGLNKVAGDHDAWAGTDMTVEDGFAWVVLDVQPGNRYKFTNLVDYLPDPWGRSYTYDEFGEMTLVAPQDTHFDRYFQIGDAQMEPRTVRILVPAQAPTHVLYAHDGQNLFDPEAFFGGWKIQDSAPPGMLVVGIDNTPARMDEYTHVPDEIGGPGTIGGLGDAYADFLQDTVRPLVNARYGEPSVVGTMGSSLGGLIAFHIADRYPGEYAFAASLSGTMGWGSIGAGVHNETMIERYAAHGHQSTVLYLDSGGDGGACGDTDNDGVDDDVDQGDNFCENAQLEGVLLSIGYVGGTDLFYVWDPGAPHNEAAWAGRVDVPLGVFADL